MNSRRRRSIKSTKRVRNPWKEPTPTHSRGSNRKLQRRERRRRREERLLRYLNKFPAVLICIITAAVTKRLPTPITRGRHSHHPPLAAARAQQPNTTQRNILHTANHLQPHVITARLPDDTDNVLRPATLLFSPQIIFCKHT